MKKAVQIIVIDDGKFPFLDTLKSNDYQIKHYKDVSDLQMIENFDVVLCDIQGVGKKLNPTRQGHLSVDLFF